MKNPFLIGQRVYLRPLERADTPLLQTWVNDQDVIRNLLNFRPMNLQGEEEFLDKVTRDPDLLVLGIALRSDDRLIGDVGLHRIQSRDRQAGLGILIGEKAEWSKGYGTEATRLIVRYAFDVLNLNRVWLHVLEDNQRGRRAYEKVGFKVEGVLRQAGFREGRYMDMITMGILRGELIEEAGSRGARPAKSVPRARRGR
jgi:Acetyltransferases, including N-acetylases of ribosomal proteins